MKLLELQCKDCRWTWAELNTERGSRDALLHARRHVVCHGHHVVIDLGLFEVRLKRAGGSEGCIIETMPRETETRD